MWNSNQKVDRCSRRGRADGLSRRFGNHHHLGWRPVTNSSNWNVAANWAGNTVPPIANDVQFASAFASGTTIRTNGNRTANGLLIHTLTPFTIAGNATDVLTL